MLSGTGALLTIGLLAQINRLAVEALAHGSTRPLFLGLGWLAALCAANSISQLILARLGSSLVARLRADLAQRFIQLDYHRFITRSASVVGVLIQDIGRIGPLVLLAPQFAYNAFLAIACAIYLLTISPPLFGILVVGLTIPLGSGFLLLRATRQQFDVMRQNEETLFSHFRTIPDAKKEMGLNSARAEHFYAEILTPAIRTAEQTMERVYLRLGLHQAWSSALTYGAVFAVVYLGRTALNLPGTSILNFVVGGLFIVGPLNFLIQANQQIAAGISSLRHLEQIGLDLRTQVDQTTPVRQEAPCATPWRWLHACGLHYRYPDAAKDREIGPFDLSIQRGELVFIVGPNGVGKTTLMHMLCGLLPATSGQLYLDDDPVPFGSPSYRLRFASVFGDFFLFDHVLDSSGICVPDERIRTWLRELDLDHQVEVEQGKLSQLKLSTGQRKRLALLQCYAEDREICLFDEWAADQDPAFRDYFYQTLLPELKQRGKTLIVISHDDRYFPTADRVIRLDHGRIAPSERSDAAGDLYARAG
ncbi:ATP-binding cassette domain-containing protein [Burkholderia alba]|uniref:ATP-binding cassette domain-containing protein n=1 Tax=Burkholderia alba TaxID=2683677 RepID=UPI002B053849|nr:ATP-binding cassette domain-containing protein [Burkholderia alba]